MKRNFLFLYDQRFMFAIYVLFLNLGNKTASWSIRSAKKSHKCRQRKSWPGWRKETQEHKTMRMKISEKNAASGGFVR